MRDRPEFAVIIPAAGAGTRIGSSLPKQYVQIRGEQVLRHTLRAFAVLPECRGCIVAVDPHWKSEAESSASGFENIVFVAGGSERQHSIRNCLEAVPPDVGYVLVHDAARPVVSSDLIYRVLEKAAEHGACLPVLPIAETIKRVDEEGRVRGTVSREGLATAQTPQGFRVDLLRNAYRYALQHGIVGTDDASLVEEMGEPVQTVRGEWENVKITWREDFERAERSLTDYSAQR